MSDDVYKLVTQLFYRYPTYGESAELIAARINAYAEDLEYIPPDLLAMALERVRASSERLPSVAAIREVVNTVRFQHPRYQAINTALWGDLVERERALHDALQEGEFDALAWEGLARAMDRAGMVYTAARLREKAGQYSRIFARVVSREPVNAY